jgi:hypothetical protein
MEGKLNWFDRMMSAATFAEAGEHETAREVLSEGKTATKKTEECPHCGGNLIIDGMHPHKA